MKALVLSKTQSISKEPNPLTLIERPIPEPKNNEILIKVSACGVCHTELDEIEGRTPPPNLPLIPGHQAVGYVEKLGPNTTKHKIGDRVGVAWIFSACGKCEYCRSNQENLCQQFKATGRDADGGYAEYMIAKENFSYKIPDFYSDTEAAPLLCAGAIGYRSLNLTNLKDGQALGLTGFGGSGHLVLKLSKYLYPSSKIYVFARRKEEQEFARSLGATWSGDTFDNSPEKLHAIIDTTPAWAPITEALKNLRPGGRLIINAIRKESRDKDTLQTLTYEDQLWMEKEIKSVANVTKTDVTEFLKVAAQAKIKPEIQTYPLTQANKALHELKEKHIRGAKVLTLK